MKKMWEGTLYALLMLTAFIVALSYLVAFDEGALERERIVATAREQAARELRTAIALGEIDVDDLEEAEGLVVADRK